MCEIGNVEDRTAEMWEIGNSEDCEKRENRKNEFGDVGIRRCGKLDIGSLTYVRMHAFLHRHKHRSSMWR